MCWLDGWPAYDSAVTLSQLTMRGIRALLLNEAERQTIIQRSLATRAPRTRWWTLHHSQTKTDLVILVTPSVFPIGFQNSHDETIVRVFPAVVRSALWQILLFPVTPQISNFFC